MKTLNIIQDLNEQIDPPKVCTGLVYRYTRDTWIGSDGDLNFRDRFRWLKRKSCPGCESCGYMEEDLRERMYDPFFNGVIFSGMKHNGLYKLQVTNISRDWESGHVDDWDLELVEYEEKENAD